MKAEVKKSGKIVVLVTKRGEYYIDSDSNPYKEDELNFDVIDNEIENADYHPLPDFGQLFGFGNIQHGVQIAVQYMKDHPSAMPYEVGQYVGELMQILKKI